MRGRVLTLTIAAFGLVAGGGCTKKEPIAVGGLPNAEADLVQRGKRVYAANCTACHNQNPTLDGSIGPAVAASSLELLERRIVHGDYPPGYTPLRSSRAMVAMPHLKDEVGALHKYLSSLTARP